jgi:Cu2+-exporting ATPase
VGRILRQVEESASRRAPVVESANRLAGWFVGTVLVVALATFVIWQSIDPARAADNAIALLIVTCPCALALSTPLAVSVAIGRAARAGIFVKGGDAIERLARPGTLVLDKTGTITAGRMALVEWDGPDWVRPLVLSLERGSSHPIAAAFRQAFDGSDAPRADEAHHVVGGGIIGIVDGHRVVVGSPAFVAAQASTMPAVASGGEGVLTPVWVAVDGEVVARAGIGDPVRDTAADAIRDLVRRGWEVRILSGDATPVVSRVAAAVGVAPSDAVGGASPEDKVEEVERQRSRAGGRPVVMVGDGINDAAAIAAASVGVGVHGGAEACLSVADVFLSREGLRPLVNLVDGAARTMRVIRRNIAFSIFYNVVGTALAVTGVLTPLIAAVLMPASSLTVVLSSWRSRTFREEA